MSTGVTYYVVGGAVYRKDQREAALQAKTVEADKRTKK